MKVRRIEYAVPQRRYSSDEVASWAGLDPEFVRNKVGIRSRAFLDEQETSLHLAAEACRKVLAPAGALDPERIKLIVYVTQNPDYRIPHSSALLQSELGLPNDVACFDVNLGCSGFVYALATVKGLMASEGIDDALLVTCDTYSRIMGRADRDTIALFGDAAAATWMSVEEGGVVGRMDYGTDGSGGENLIIRSGGAARPLSFVHREPMAGDEPREYRLSMNGRGIFNFMMERIPSSVDRCLAKNGLGKDDIDLFVFHQGSRFLLDNLRRKLGLDEARVPSNLEELGNTVSSSIPILLADLAKAGRLEGRRVLVSGFGVGLSWASNVIRF